jgi:hypothetical protein
MSRARSEWENPSVALVWLSLRVRWRRAWMRPLAVAVLIGGVGGFILAAAASAQRVEGTYQTLIDEIGAPDLAVIPACERAAGFGCTTPPDQVSGDVVVERLERLAVVEQVRLVESVMPYLVDAEGGPLLATADDEYGCFDDDRSVSMLALGPGGAAEQATPFRLDGELTARGGSGVVLALATAQREGLAVGDGLRLAGWCTGADDGTPAVLAKPIDLTVTGVSVGPLDIEPRGTGIAIEPAYVDPIVVDTLVSAGAELQVNAVVWLDRAASPAAVIEGLATYDILVDFRERAAMFDETLATDARLLWLLAGVGAAGAVLLLAPIVARNVRDNAGDTAILVALGSTRKQIAIQALAHVGVLGLIGALLAAVIAPPISSFMPRGFSVAIAPDRPVWFDGQATIVGVVLLVSAVIAMGARAAWSIGNPNQTGVSRSSTRRGLIVGSSRLRPAAHSGVLTAVGAPAGPRQASPWPTFVSMAIAGATCVASLTFLAGLDHLERTPSLVGWNWDAAVGFDEDAAERVPAVLSRIHQIDGVEMVTAGTIYPPAFPVVHNVGVVVWPWSFATGPRAISPTLLTGRAPDGPDEVAISSVFAEGGGLVVGDVVSLARPALASQLAEALGQRALELGVVDLAPEQPDDSPVVATFEITGLAVLPLQRTEEFAQATFTLNGLAAFLEPSEDELAAAVEWLPDGLAADLQAEADDFLADTDIEDRGVYVRFSGDLQSTAAALARIEGVADVIAPNAEQVLTTGIALNLGDTDQVPTALMYVVSGAAAALLAYLLVTAVRARRFEFAVMRALGLSDRGVRWSIAAQATATTVIPLLVAIPVGVIVGRQAWLTYARSLEVVPEPVTPWSVPAFALAAMVVANLVALVPGWATARRSPGGDLRAG